MKLLYWNPGYSKQLLLWLERRTDMKMFFSSAESAEPDLTFDELDCTFINRIWPWTLILFFFTLIDAVIWWSMIG